MSCDDPVLLGVDGGATGIRCHEVRRTNEADGFVYALGVASAEMDYPCVSGFTPVSPEQQRAELDGGNLRVRDLEIQQAATWIETAATVIARVAELARATSVRIGIGMPGIKGPDERGIRMMNNGPRMPDFLDRLEERLTSSGVRLNAPIRRIGDDGAYSGLGEEFAAEGKFRDVRNAYYIGGGTGLAECLKLDGRIVPMSGLECGISRAWELASPLGPTYEKLVSAASMNRIYAALCNSANGQEAGFPESDAMNGNPIAESWIRTVAMLLSHLIFERVVTLQRGLVSLSSDPSVNAPSSAPCQLDRVVLGQRIGQIFAEQRFRPVFASHVESTLAQMIRSQAGVTPTDIAAVYLSNDALRPGFLVASELRAAPAIGAVVDAMRADDAFDRERT